MALEEPIDPHWELGNFTTSDNPEKVDENPTNNPEEDIFDSSNEMMPEVASFEEVDSTNPRDIFHLSKPIIIPEKVDENPTNPEEDIFVLSNEMMPEVTSFEEVASCEEVASFHSGSENFKKSRQKTCEINFTKKKLWIFSMKIK